MFFKFIIAMLLGLASPSNNNNGNTQGSVSTYDEGPGGPTGGDTGQNPPPKGS